MFVRRYSACIQRCLAYAQIQAPVPSLFLPICSFCADGRLLAGNTMSLLTKATARRLSSVAEDDTIDESMVLLTMFSGASPHHHVTHCFVHIIAEYEVLWPAVDPLSSTYSISAAMMNPFGARMLSTLSRATTVSLFVRTGSAGAGVSQHHSDGGLRPRLAAV